MPAAAPAATVIAVDTWIEVEVDRLWSPARAYSSWAGGGGDVEVDVVGAFIW
jgi:hypothetical protein